MIGKLTGLESLNLANLRFEIQSQINFEIEAGASPTKMAQRNGHAHGFMRIPWQQDRRTEDWHWSTLYGLTEPVNLSVRVEFKNLDVVETAMFQMGLNSQQFLGIGILDALKETRQALGVTYEMAAERLGIVKSGIYKLETADDPYLGSLYRLTRALGGQLRLRTVLDVSVS